MNNKTLIFLTDNYPIAAREFFIDDEMRVIAPYFDRILVLTAADKEDAGLNRFVPQNLETIKFSRVDLESSKWKSIWRLFTPTMLSEAYFVMRKLKPKQWIQAFKIMFVEIHRANKLKDTIISTLHKQQINPNNCIFYSYWHDYKALALALLRKNNTSLKCVARAHGWDVFAERQNPPYLPFKKLTIDNLSKTISISEAGRKAFESYLSCNLGNEVIVSRLGKFNHRKPLFEKKNEGFLICSCSDITHYKRVDKIIDTIALLKTRKVHWVHIGDDKLRQKIEQYAKQKLSDGQFEFKGIVPNCKILDYYALNYIDLFINLSETEGVPVSIMEALSAGIPVLATNVGGTSEAVNQAVGFLIEPDFEVQNVANVIDEYFSSPCSKHLKYRRNAYDFWDINYEAGTNYTNFVKTMLS